MHKVCGYGSLYLYIYLHTPGSNGLFVTIMKTKIIFTLPTFILSLVYILQKNIYRTCKLL
jgi:hypothetical protein